MTNISVGKKIKILGALLLFTVFFVISVTIYLNQNNKKDALLVNIAGKERMLSQKITKNIFLLLFQAKSNDFSEIDVAISEFKFGIETLQHGNELLKIAPAPTDDIRNQISKVLILWNVFSKNVKQFQDALLINDKQKIQSLSAYFINTNNVLLEEIDKLVTLYTEYIETKNSFIKNFQYISFGFLIIFAIYSIVQLKQIEAHGRELIEKSKQISQGNFNDIELVNINSEKEFNEIADNLNCFINKVSLAMNYSQNALDQSKMAAEKLENITDEFSLVIKELENKSSIENYIDKSEDIVIESTEELLKTTKKLQALKNELDRLLLNCKS